MAKKELTNKQRAVLEYIEECITSEGKPPTVREIGERFGIRSTNGVRTHLSALIKKGYLKKTALISRGLELARQLAAPVRSLPVVGAVPAGVPIDAVENIEGEVAVDSTFLPKSESFSLRVTGDSMIGAGIRDGDLIVVQKQSVARKGDIVVAVINNEATVKRFVPDGRKVRLEPENEDFDPIIVDKRSGDFYIAGKVVGLMRRF